jgi:hypothetical protein
VLRAVVLAASPAPVKQLAPEADDQLHVRAPVRDLVQLLLAIVHSTRQAVEIAQIASLL